MFKIGDKVKYIGNVYVNLIGKTGIIHDFYDAGNTIVYFPDLDEGFDVGRGGIKLWSTCKDGERRYLLIRKKNLEKIQGDDNMIKIGSVVKYDGAFYDLLWGENGVVKKIEGEYALVHYPDLEEGVLIDDGIVLHDNHGEYCIWLELKDLISVNNGGDSMRILVIGNTGNYETGVKKGDILEVTSEAFGYVVTERGRVKDIDYVEYKEGEMIAHINDLRDCFKAGLRFTDENNLVYPDGKIALKAENLQYLDRTFKLKRVNCNQIIIGNEKVELCFGKKEIGTIVEFRR